MGELSPHVFSAKARSVPSVFFISAIILYPRFALSADRLGFEKARLPPGFCKISRATIQPILLELAAICFQKFLLCSLKATTVR